MSNPIDNPPAFPKSNRTCQSGDIEWNSDGMSLRDYFAAKAMNAEISFAGLEGGDVDHIAGMSYQMADAMLKARSKSQPS